MLINLYSNNMEGLKHISKMSLINTQKDCLNQTHFLVISITNITIKSTGKTLRRKQLRASQGVRDAAQ